MPGLISSAAAGKKAAPKAPARRRAPAAPQPTASCNTIPVITAPPVAHPETPTPVPSSAQVQNEGPQDDPASTQPPELAPTITSTSNAQLPESPAHIVQDESVEDSSIARERIQSHENIVAESREHEEIFTSIDEPTTAEALDTHTVVTRPLSSAESNGLTSQEPTNSPQRSSSDVSRKRSLLASSKETPQPPIKRPKRSSARSNATVQAVIDGEQSNASEPVASPAADETIDRPAGSRNSQSTQTGSSKLRKAQVEGKKKVSRTRAKRNQDRDNNGIADATPEPADNTEPRPVKRKRKRKDAAAGEGGDGAVHEELDPEQHEIDPRLLSMYKLTFDTHNGKVSEREKAMAAIDWDEVARMRREAAELTASGPQQSDGNDVVGSVEGVADATAGSGPAQQLIRFEMDANGELVPVEESLRIDRTADARRAAQSGEPVLDQNELTSRINRTTWANENRRDPSDRVAAWKWKSDPWSEEETDRFYDALRMFGTDFFIISKMFAPKTRRMIKAKFVREERIEPDRINNALLGKDAKPMNLEHYAQETGRELSVFTKYDDCAHAESVIRESLMTEAIREETELATKKAEEEKLKEQEKLQAQEKRQQGRNGRRGRQAEATF